MAHSGKNAKTCGKLFNPVCQHSPMAKAFLTSHLCFQDRVAKERSSAMTANSISQSPEDMASKSIKNFQSMSALELARHEYHPIGGCSKHNNNSGEMRTVMGPSSWAASGGIKSEYGSHVGKAILPGFGCPAHLKTMQMRGSLSASTLDKVARKEGHMLAKFEQAQALRQHGQGTIIGLRRGEVMPENEMEEQFYHQGKVPSRHGSAHEQFKPRTGDSRLTGTSRLDSWGSARNSNPSSELRRIHELGERARAVGMKGAAVHMAKAMRVYDEDTTLAVEKGILPPHDHVEEALLVQHRPVSGLLGNHHRKRTPLAGTPGGHDSHKMSRCSSKSTTSWGSAHSNPQSELRRIHAMAGDARELARRGAAAHQIAAMRQVDEDTVLHDFHHPDHKLQAPN